MPRWYDCPKYLKHSWSVGKWGSTMANNLYNIHRIIQDLRDEIDTRADLPVTWPQTFLLVAAAGKDGITLTDLGALIRVAPSVISRIVKLMSTYQDAAGVTQGADLFQTRNDLQHRHRLRVYLTPKGEEVQKRLEDAMK
jgi:DNA-binding MarR family transcriptional regulator